MSTAINTTHLLETKPVGKLLVQYSVPAIVGMTVTSLYNIIDSITKEDIQKAANYVFNNKPIYSLVASKDTLNANKEFLSSLENK